jgi:hypothetical protein
MDRVANFLALHSGAFAYGSFPVVPTFYEISLEMHLTYRDALFVLANGPALFGNCIRLPPPKSKSRRLTSVGRTAKP